MTVYVDMARNNSGRLTLSNIYADTIPELHAMADPIGLFHKWFQPVPTPHYTLSKAMRAKAIALGAVELNRRQLAEYLKSKRTQGEAAA